MRKFTITVNGQDYDVVVKDGGAAAAAPAPQQQNNSVPIQLGDLSDFEEILSDGEVPF